MGLVSVRTAVQGLVGEDPEKDSPEASSVTRNTGPHSLASMDMTHRRPKWTWELRG